MAALFQKIAIVGAGALGSYYGARLALAGSDVCFLMRGELDAVRERGITLHEKDSRRHLARANAFATTTEIGPVDLVLIAIKTTANADLAQLLPPLIGPTTVVVTLQNGLGNEETVAALVGAERVLGGLCFIAVTRCGPGELRGFHTPGAITLGEFGRAAGDRTYAVAGLFKAAGVKCIVVDDLAQARWRKLVWNIPFNGLSIAAGGVATDVIMGSPALEAEARALMDEVALAGRAQGFEVPEVFIQSQLDVTRPMGPYQPSSLVDFLAKRPVEVEAIWGEALRRARAAGVPTPRLAMLYALLVQLARTTGT